MRMGGGSQQFGIDEEQLPEAIRLAKKSAWLHVVGIHVYGGTQIFDVGGLLAHCAQVVETPAMWRPNLDSRSSSSTLVAALACPTSRTYQNWTWTHLPKGYRGVVQSCRKHTMLERVRPIIELGRYLVAEARDLCHAGGDIQTLAWQDVCRDRRRHEPSHHCDRVRPCATPGKLPVAVM